MKTQVDVTAIQNILAKADLLYSESQVSQVFDIMASAINQHLYKKYPVCLSVMLGGLLPTGQLLPRLNFPLEVDYVHATRYRGNTQGGELHWIKYPQISLVERSVLVIDDILDEGLTLQAIIEYCLAQGASEVFTAVLVEKEHNRRIGIQQADFTGLKVPDRYVFGYGMDYQGQLRYAPGIYAVQGL